jgi:hypothetical protein
MELLTDVKTELGGGQVAVTPEQQETKDGLGKDIQDTVENGFRVRSNDVSSLR